MKVMTQSKWMRTLVGAAGASALLFGMGMSGSVLAGIADTKHNLGTGGTKSNKTTTGTAEICVFCHTPHAANTGVAAPLWNKQLPQGVTYTTYSSTNSTTITGQVVAVGSVSLACLSCHDGTQAMDNIINAPGSGGYDSTGGGTNGLGYTWTGSPRADANGGLTGIANLGGGALGATTADLSNDHPIGIQYCGGGVTGGSGTSITGSCTDADFTAPQTASINSAQAFWVDTGTAGRQKTDMILYPRDFSQGNGTPSVECASCHDPHTTNTTFLRIENTGSAVCLACHTK